MIKSGIPNVFKTTAQDLTGIWRGVVEDNKDPEKIGRCKVRVFGLHSPNKEESNRDGIPTDHLPWAEPALPVIGGGTTGYGMFGVPLQGSHVFLFFENKNIRKPIYFASAPGIPQEGPDTNKGFSDPDGKYPVEHRLKEPDTHRLNRGEVDKTTRQWRKDKSEEGVELGDETKDSWDEPKPTEKIEYPNTWTFTTEKGIGIEINNTDGGECISISHPQNAYFEITPEGEIIMRSNGNIYQIARGDVLTYATSGAHVTCDENFSSKIEGESDNQVKGYSRIKTEKGQTFEAGSGMTLKSEEYGMETNKHRHKCTGKSKYSTMGMLKETVMGSRRTRMMGMVNTMALSLEKQTCASIKKITSTMNLIG